MMRIPSVLGMLGMAVSLCSCYPFYETTYPQSAPEKTYTLKVQAKLPLWDVSKISKNFGKGGKKYERIMVVPPSGTTRGTFEKELAALERGFIARDLSVVSPAVTARVENKGGQNLSDLERALVLAKEANADAVLQIGMLGWQEGERSRFFRAEPEETALKEVTEEEFVRDGEGAKCALSGGSIRFMGRLVEVETGEVVVSFDIVQDVVRNMPSDYEAACTRESGVLKQNGEYLRNRDGSIRSVWEAKIKTENWPFLDDAWKRNAQSEILRDLVSRITDLVTGKIQRPPPGE